jgi:hypothetical protein
MSAFGSARAVVTPLWTCQTGLSGHGSSPPPWLDSVLNCNVAPEVQRIGNLAIGLIRQAGYNKIAATIRRIRYDTGLLLAILGLKNPS